MSTASSPGPNNLLLLVVLGVGAYYLMTRRVMAQQQPVYQNQQANRTAQNASIIGAGLGALSNLFKGSGSSVPYLGTSDGRSQSQWDVTPQGPDGPRYNNPSAYVAGDGVAANPPFSSAYDYTGEYWY